MLTRVTSADPINCVDFHHVVARSKVNSLETPVAKQNARSLTKNRSTRYLNVILSFVKTLESVLFRIAGMLSLNLTLQRAPWLLTITPLIKSEAIFMVLTEPRMMSELYLLIRLLVENLIISVFRK